MYIRTPEKAAEDRSNNTVVCRTQDVATNRIKIISENGSQECLGTVMGAVTFVIRGNKYFTMEMTFTTKKKTASHASKMSCHDTLTLLFTQKDSRNIHVCIGRVIPCCNRASDKGREKQVSEQLAHIYYTTFKIRW